MAEELRIQITAKDGASQVFKSVADSAKKVSDELETAGRDGEQGLEKIERGARDADREVDKISESAKRASLSFRDFDFAITAIGAGLTYAGNAALEQEQTIIGLQAAYGDAAEEMINFADQMANVTIFNDDDIMRGERYFATLRNNYDLTIQEVQELMQVTADLASAYGTSFEDASSRITAAIRGEGEAAEYLGLTMNQQAIDRENLTLTMTNQEAAQFRLNALYEQTGVYQGTAAALAESEVGTRAKLTNAIQDNAQAMADFAGPLITQAAGIGMASTGLASMIGVFTRLGPALRNSSVAMSALGVAMNPVVLGLGALAGAGVLAWNIFRDGREATQSLEDALIQLGDVATNLRLGYRDQEANWVDEMRLDTEYAIALGQTWLNDMDLMWEMAGTKAEEWGISQQDAVYRLQEAYEVTGDHAREFASAVDTVGAAFANSAIDHAALDAALDQLDQQYRTRQITLDEYADAYIDIAGNIDRYRIAQEGADDSTATFVASVEKLRSLASPTAAGISEMASSVARVEAAIEDGSLSAEELLTYITDIDNRMARGNMTSAMYAESMENVDEALLGAEESAWGNVASSDALAVKMDELSEASDAAAESIRNAGAASGEFASDMADAVDAAEQASDAMGNAFGAATATRIEEITTRTQELATAMLELSNNADYVSQINLTGLGTNATIAAEGLTDAAGALESTFRVVVGNTNAIGQQVDSIQAWADELINVAGEYGKIDDLLSAGLITLEQYNAAQQAYNEITSSNADIQNYILEIQTNQAPLIAEQTAALENQLEVITNMSDAQEQLAALGWMDDDMQGRVQQFAEMGNQLAALGPAGAQSLQQIVDGIVATDPVLTAMLEDLNLIEETIDASGNKTYTVNMDAVGAMDSTERLIASIDALTLALGGVPPLDIEVTGWSDLELVKKDIEELSALGAQDILIDIATRLNTPEGGAEGDPLAAITAWAASNPVEMHTVIDTPDDDPFGDIRAAAQNSPIEIPVVFANAASDAGGAAGSAVAGLTAGWGAATIEVTADTSEADAAIATTQEAADALDGDTANVLIIGDESAAMTSIGNVGHNLATLDGATAQVIINAQDNATAVIQDVGSSLGGLDSASATVMIYGNAEDAYADINAISAYNGTVLATSYIDIVTRQTTVSGMAGWTEWRHGGVPGYDTGGVVIQAAESGPELAYFAGGGVALLPSDGLYAVPEGTYISPNNALNGVNVGGLTVNVNVGGNVYGMDDLTERVARELAPAIEEAATVHYREQGANW